MATLSTEGLKVRTVSEILEAIKEALRTTVSPNLDLSSTSLLGQFSAIIANQLGLEEEALLQIYTGMDPSTATGDALDRISAFTGTFRAAATQATVSCSLGFSQTGTFTSGTLLASPSGSAQILFSNVHDVVVTSVPYTASNVLMRAIDTGPVNIVLGNTGLGSLTQIASPVAGWDFIFASSSFTQGSEVESDASLRLRRITEIFAAGSTSTSAIRADISARVSGVRSVTVTENTSSQTVNSIPPYGLEVVVDAPGASDKEIAQVIFDNKSAGAPTYGNTFYDIEDSSDNLHRIFFSRPVEIPVQMTVTITHRPGSTFPGIDFVKQTIISNATASWVPGLDVAPSQISHWVFDDVPGVLDVSTSVFGSPNRYTINNQQIAVITSSNDITVTATVGTI